MRKHLPWDMMGQGRVIKERRNPRSRTCVCVYVCFRLSEELTIFRGETAHRAHEALAETQRNEPELRMPDLEGLRKDTS